MSLSLPLASSPIRELIDMHQLAALGSVDARRQLPMHWEAKRQAEAAFASDRAIRDVHCLVLRANGELHLERFGRRGAWHCVWNFGVL